MFLQTNNASEIKLGTGSEIKIPQSEKETQAEIGEVLKPEGSVRQVSENEAEALKLAQLRKEVTPQTYSATQMNPVIEDRAEFSAEYAAKLADILNLHDLKGLDPADIAEQFAGLPGPDKLEK